MGYRAIFACAIVFGFCTQSLSAEPASGTDKLTVSELQKRIKAIDGKSDVPAAVKDKIKGFLEGAVERLEISQEQIEKAQKLERRLGTIAETLQATQKRLTALPAGPDPASAIIDDMDELARRVVLREKELDDPQNGIRKQIADLDTEASTWRTRPEELVNQLAEAEDRLREIGDEEDELANGTDSRELTQAHSLFLQARRRRAETELRMAQAESAWYQSADAAELLQVQQELAAKTLTLKAAELQLLQDELGKRRGDEADQRVHQAETVVAGIIPALKKIAEENLQLAKEERDVTNKLRDVERRHEATSATLAELQKEFDRTQKMVSDVGLTDTIGLLLRQQRSKLVSPRTLRSNLSHRNDVVRETRMRLFQLATEREALIDMDAVIARRTAELDPVGEQQSISEGLRTLLSDQRQFYKAVEADYTRYFKQLIEMDVLERRMLELTTAYTNYVDERVLWIRTGQWFGRSHIAKSTEALQSLSEASLWNSIADTAWRDASRRPVPWVIAGILFAAWVATSPAWKVMIHRKGNLAANPSCRDLWPTLQTICYTVVLASGWPSIMGFAGWRLDHSASSSPFVHAVAAGLLRAATFGFPLELLRVVCQRGGLGERHFDWPITSVRRFRRNLNWFLPVGIVLIGLIGLIEGTSDEHRLDSIGRMTFLVFAGLSAAFTLITVRRSHRSADVRVTGIDDADVASDRFWRFAPLLGTTLCIVLLALASTGFFYTALQLTWRAQRTALLAVGLLLLRAVIRRWIALERRRMAVLQDAELQTIAESGREPLTGGHNPFLFPRWHWPDFRLNLTQIVTQMRSLLDTGLMTLAVVGLCIIWSDVTPALNILDRFTLWNTTVEQTVTVQDAEHGPSAKTILKSKPVTAANLGLAVLIVAIAVVAGRNVPGLVEVILLEHLAVDAGIRFATTCLVRYAIFIAGVCGAFAQVSIGWSNVQWLVAAASVGLGFGLQEIFCNFVSGIILLFERPMRVGDVVTIGDTTGTVSRIRFRATTIVDGDRKELIVPNKEFITGHLLNWTLSDRVNRVGVKVVVASSNDPQHVRRLLLEIASQHPLLLKDPAPSATLEDVNGGLTFMLRGFLPSLDSRGTAIHDLYTMINGRFKAEGIELSCPTQEIFVRMDAHSATPSAPHQPQTAPTEKRVPIDIGATLRSA